MTYHVTLEDWNWWLGLSRSLGWKTASTYSGGGTHEYAVADKTPGFSRADALRASAVIHAYGEPQRFFGHPGIYLEDTLIGYKYWYDDKREIDPDTDLINRALIFKDTGPQDFPRTSSAWRSSWDSKALTYDEDSPIPSGLGAAIRKAISHRRWDHAPTVLDIGAGTGGVLDYLATAQSAYTAVEPSQGMLNQLCMKFPDVKSVFPVPFEYAVRHEMLNKKWDVVAAIRTAQFLPEGALRQAAHRVKAGGILLVGPNNKGELESWGL